MGEGIVAIAAAHTSGEDFVGIATNHVNTLYALPNGACAFQTNFGRYRPIPSNF